MHIAGNASLAGHATEEIFTQGHKAPMNGQVHVGTYPCVSARKHGTCTRHMGICTEGLCPPRQLAWYGPAMTPPLPPTSPPTSPPRHSATCNHHTFLVYSTVHHMRPRRIDFDVCGSCWRIRWGSDAGWWCTTTNGACLLINLVLYG